VNHFLLTVLIGTSVAELLPIAPEVRGVSLFPIGLPPAHVVLFRLPQLPSFFHASSGNEAITPPVPSLVSEGDPLVLFLLHSSPLIDF